MTSQWAWATHQPAIQAAMAAFRPDYVLEIGIGTYSTPYFLPENTIVHTEAKYKGIEQDVEWIKKISNFHPELDIAHHDMKSVAVGDKYASLTNEQSYSVVMFYESLKTEIRQQTGIKVLFVDCFASTRMYALNSLIDDFDVIIYHDSHPNVFRFYGYQKVKVSNKFRRYQLCSKTSWTDILLRKSVAGISRLGLFLEYINPAILEFDKRWKVKSDMKLISIENTCMHYE